MTCGHVIARDGKLDPTILCVQSSIYHLKNQDNGTEIATSSIHAGRTCLKRRADMSTYMSLRSNESAHARI
jgi:hypothetical protein